MHLYRLVSIILPVLFAFCSYSSAEAATWKLYKKYAVTQRSTILERGSINNYYDTESMVREPDGTIRVWTKTTIPVAAYTTALPAVVLALIEVKCPKKKLRILKVLKTYSDYRIEDDLRTGSWDYITPDGASEVLYKTVCKKPLQKKSLLPKSPCRK
ncbi:MAG: surface-adhesin E family protein [Nitrospirota bacterium]